LRRERIDVELKAKVGKVLPIRLTPQSSVEHGLILLGLAGEVTANVLQVAGDFKPQMDRCLSIAAAVLS
jgi:hypothetical protein